MRRVGVVAGSVAAGVAVGIEVLLAPRQSGPAFLTVPVKPGGDIVSTISATGTIGPEAAVDIGTGSGRQCWVRH